MAPVRNQPFTALRRPLRGALGVRFARFAGAAAAALTATETALTVASGVFHLTATPAALVSWLAGAVVSYALSRWAWNRRGRPDVLRETIPFWAISVLVIVILTLANRLGYHSARWLHLTGARQVLWVDFIWLVANCGTFLLRFALFHYVLFRDRTAGPRETGAQASGPPTAVRPRGLPGCRRENGPGESQPADSEERAPRPVSHSVTLPWRVLPPAAASSGVPSA